MTSNRQFWRPNKSESLRNLSAGFFVGSFVVQNAMQWSKVWHAVRNIPSWNKYVRFRDICISTRDDHMHGMYVLPWSHQLNIHCPTRAGWFINFGLLGEQSSPKLEIPCRGHRWTAVQNLTPLALSSVEKSVTVQKKAKNTQTVNDISTPCLYVWIIMYNLPGSLVCSPYL